MKILPAMSLRQAPRLGLAQLIAIRSANPAYTPRLNQAISDFGPDRYCYDGSTGKRSDVNRTRDRHRQSAADESGQMWRDKRVLQFGPAERCCKQGGRLFCSAGVS